MKLGKRKCKECGEPFQKVSPLQSVCSVQCASNRAYKLNKAKREKELKAKVKGMKSEIMTRGEWIKLLQATFNTYIRLRDKDLPCVSCGKTNVEEFHAGHFVATTYQYHRFNEKNVHKQCSKCNTHLRGNLIPYRIELIKRIGLEEVEYIENTRHMMLEITIPEIKNMIVEYKNKIKSLQNKK